MTKGLRKHEKISASCGCEAEGIVQQANFLETVLKSLTHPFYVIDARDYTVKLANAAARAGRITGTTKCYALTHRRKKPCRAGNHPCPLEIVKRTKKPVTLEHVHFDRDGNTRNVEVHGFPICDGAGNVVQMIEYCLDITARKQAQEALRQSEHRYRCFVQSFQGIVYQGHLNFVPIFFHGAVEEITGYKAEEFTAGAPRWDQVVHPDDLTLVLETGKGLYARPGYATQREYRIVRKDEQVRWIHELIQSVSDDSGPSILVQGVIHDITDRKRMEKDLRKHREDLEALVQARTAELTKANQQLRDEIARRRHLENELLSVIERERQRTGRELHDSIGQQLSGIAFMIEVLGEKLADRGRAEESSYVDRIAACVGQATEQTRVLARGLHPIDLNGDGLAAALQALAANTQQLFGISCMARCEQAVFVRDASAVINLYRIAQEAITNAIRHGKAKHIEIELAVQDGGLKLTVANDGLGFPAGAMRDKGMGLRIMRHRAEMIGSSLDIRPGDNGGTVVTCVCPSDERA